MVFPPPWEPKKAMSWLLMKLYRPQKKKRWIDETIWLTKHFSKKQTMGWIHDTTNLDLTGSAAKYEEIIQQKMYWDGFDQQSSDFISMWIYGAGIIQDIQVVWWNIQYKLSDATEQVIQEDFIVWAKNGSLKWWIEESCKCI